MAPALLVLTLTLHSAGQAASSTGSAYTYHSIVPLGTESVRLQPGGHNIYLLASAECGSFEGLRRIGEARNARLVAADGSLLPYYPSEVAFRLTASTFDKPRTQDSPVDVNANQEVNSFLLNLRMRLKIFQGLDAYEIEPEEVDLIGMPATVPYNERIYRATFHLEHVPSDARIVLQVLDSSDQRIARFHLELL